MRYEKTYSRIYLIVEFFIVFIFILLPPMLISENDVVSSPGNFSLSSVLRIVFFSILLLVLSYDVLLPDSRKSSLKICSEFSLDSFFKHCISFLILLAMLFFLNFIFALFSGKTTTENKNQFSFLATLQIVLAAIFEEILYRKYCTKRLSEFFTFKFGHLAAILLSAIIFALAHRYNGWIAVSFSFFSAILFSILYESTNFLIYPCFMHIIYNLVIFFFL